MHPHSPYAARPVHTCVRVLTCSAVFFPQVLQDLADDFVENLAACACELARHRGGSVLEARDIQLALGESLPIRFPTRHPASPCVPVAHTLLPLGLPRLCASAAAAASQRSSGEHALLESATRSTVNSSSTLIIPRRTSLALRTCVGARPTGEDRVRPALRERDGRPCSWRSISLHQHVHGWRRRVRYCDTCIIFYLTGSPRSI